MTTGRTICHPRSMTRDLPLPGGCNCGEVRYLITQPILTTYICHCHLCQKRTGSAFSMSVVIPADGFDLARGKPLRTERRLAGGARIFAHVCPACHSRTHTQREGRKTVNVRAGTLDDTSWVRPVAQFWTSSAQPWAVVHGDILSYAEQPTDFTPLLIAWREQSK
ncbi:GFA family protein [Dankookia rubra]|uniref:GFA family protein n=2 Tax=Dankookia rubra TaxID=1442381 RepID=A0A4R5Q627_9PROT|nr:GFA family protein [Dankookia rubra]